MSRSSIRACGIVFCYNEEHILGHTLEYYLRQGIDLVVFDNCSTDASPEIAARYRDEGGFPGRLIDIVEVKTDGYEWGKILKAANDYMHAHLDDFDWILLIDADGFYQSPVSGANLLEFMADSQRSGYNLADGKVFDFIPTEKDDPSVENPVERMRYCRVEPFGPLAQHKIFRYHPSVDFHTQLGHTCERDDARPGPVRFLYRHYPWVSYEHGVQKIFNDRMPRYVERKENPIYHVHYLELLPRREDLVKRAADYQIFELGREQVSRRAFYAIAAREKAEPAVTAVRLAGRAVRFAGRAVKAAPRLVRRFMEVWSEDRKLAAGKVFGYPLKRFRERGKDSPGAAACPDANATVACADPAVVAATNAAAARPEPPAVDKSITNEEIAEQKAYAVGFPLTYHFLMTTACNARCLFCNQDPKQPLEEITLEKFRTMVSHIPVESARYFYLSGGGDPLLCRDFFPILNYINEEFPWIEVHVRTNGLLVKKYAAELAGTDIRLEVSVHAASDETNNRILQSKKAADIFEGIALLNQELEARGKTMDKAFFPALFKLNIHELPALIEKAAELVVGAVESYFCRFYLGEGYDHGERVREEDSLFHSRDEYDEVVTECEQLAASLGVCFMHEPKFTDEFCPKPCLEPWRMMLVDWNGEVFPCCGGEMWFRDKVTAGEYSFGNLLEEELYQLWNNETYVMIRRTLSPNYDDNLVAECADCHSILCFRGPSAEAGHFIRK